jgi:hypothetical protein
MEMFMAGYPHLVFSSHTFFTHTVVLIFFGMAARRKAALSIFFFFFFFKNGDRKRSREN